MKLIGLFNLGNTCYINSVIQCFINDSEFVNKIASFKANKESNDLFKELVTFLNEPDQDNNKVTLKKINISQFIDYLQEIGAKFTIYHTGSTSRIQVKQPTQSSTSVEVIPLNESQRFTRESAEKDTEYMYLFTDNAGRTSGSGVIDPNSWYAKKYGADKKYASKTQAVARGLKNVYPITTMVDDKRTQWTDDQFNEYKKIIDDEIETIKQASKKYNGIKFGAEMPFGKGAISNMKDSAPKIWNYLNTKLAEIGIDNTGDIPVSTQPTTSIEESFFKDFIIRFNENHPEFRNLEVPKTMTYYKDYLLSRENVVAQYEASIQSITKTSDAESQQMTLELPVDNSFGLKDSFASLREIDNNLRKNC